MGKKLFNMGMRNGALEQNKPTIIKLLIIMVFSLSYITLFIPQVYADTFYGGIRVGVYIPKSDDLKEANEGLYPELFGGYSYKDILSVEGGIGATDIKLNKDVTFDILPITMALIAEPKFGPIFPYAEVGGGMYFTSFHDYYRDKDYTDTPFGTFFGLGVNIGNPTGLRLGIGARYVMFDATLHSQTICFDGLVVNLNASYYF